MSVKSERMRSEANVSNDAAVEVSKEGGKSFRNNVGNGWVGVKAREYTEGGNRYLVIKNPRRIDFGLAKGSADRIGWVPVVITQEMVGQTFARFMSLEIKREDGRASTEQVNWHNIVTRDGGLSGFIRDRSEVAQVIAGRSIDP